MIAEGRIAEQGTHHQLLRLEGLYASMVAAAQAERNASAQEESHAVAR